VKKLTVMALVLAVMAGNAMATYMLTRGASVIKPLQFGAVEKALTPF